MNLVNSTIYSVRTNSLAHYISFTVNKSLQKSLFFSLTELVRIEYAEIADRSGRDN